MRILRNFFCFIKIDYQKELKEIRNVENQKLEILRQKHKHTYDAVMWYKQNKERFEGVVHMPMMMSVRLFSCNLCRM